MDKEQAIEKLNDIRCHVKETSAEEQALVMAIDALKQPVATDTNFGDTISRQAALEKVRTMQTYKLFADISLVDKAEVQTELMMLPPAQPEALTDKEQRIFLAAMGREEKVCKQVDDECRDCREPYEDSLVRTCHEITRKVKGALWT